jgi:hypothetical protein
MCAHLFAMSELEVRVLLEQRRDFLVQGLPFLPEIMSQQKYRQK